MLHGVILRVRPGKVAEAYQRVWTDAGSPLLVFSQRQGQALQTALSAARDDRVVVTVAMRYGKPGIAAGLEQLRRARARRLLILPLYPQYSASTSASVFDAVAAVLRHWRWVPDVRFVSHYHDHPAYIMAMTDSIAAHRQQHGTGQQLLFSFHGLPRAMLLAGDPYHCQCHTTARLIAAHLGLRDDEWQIVFQSRFGRQEWLSPYADKVLAALPAQGIRQVDVVCPGFAADCLETLDEINVENREVFLGAGGERFEYIPALNDAPGHIRALVDLVEQHARGWESVDAGARSTVPHPALSLGAAR